jgi:hypothetical protein
VKVKTIDEQQQHRQQQQQQLNVNIQCNLPATLIIVEEGLQQQPQQLAIGVFVSVVVGGVGVVVVGYGLFIVKPLPNDVEFAIHWMLLISTGLLLLLLHTCCYCHKSEMCV